VIHKAILVFGLVGLMSFRDQLDERFVELKKNEKNLESWVSF
jgi:hypothetical protein